jgi:hypothetical protein
MSQRRREDSTPKTPTQHATWTKYEERKLLDLDIKHNGDLTEIYKDWKSAVYPQTGANRTYSSLNHKLKALKSVPIDIEQEDSDKENKLTQRGGLHLNGFI